MTSNANTSKNATVYNAESARLDLLAEQLTPTFMRQPLWLALVRALFAPLKSVCVRYTAFKRLKVQRMSYNGQVRLLENIINRLMLGYYNPNDPVIYLAEPDPIEDFMISPSGAWIKQDSIHFNLSGKEDWDDENDDPLEAPEEYGILHDRSDSDPGYGFEVHLTQRLAPASPANSAKTLYQSHGGLAALKEVVETYKLAGKRYVVIQD